MDFFNRLRGKKKMQDAGAKQITPEEREILRTTLVTLARSERTLEFLRESVQFKGTTGEQIAAAVLTETPLFAERIAEALVTWRLINYGALAASRRLEMLHGSHLLRLAIHHSPELGQRTTILNSLRKVVQCGDEPFVDDARAALDSVLSTAERPNAPPGAANANSQPISKRGAADIGDKFEAGQAIQTTGIYKCTSCGEKFFMIRTDVSGKQFAPCLVCSTPRIGENPHAGAKWELVTVKG
jgi:hypothetical protein